MIYLRIPTLVLKFILSIIILGFTSCKKELPKQATLVCPENGCIISSGTNGIDIEVDFAQSQNVPTLTGVLHGVTTETPPEYVNGIRLASARARNNFELLYSYDIKPVLVLSDLVNLNGASPATDWNSYESQVRDVVNTYGNLVIYDIWNEPDTWFFWPWWSGIDQTPVDEEDLNEFFEAFKRAHDIIRDELGESAWISGPSYGKLSEPLIQRFMDFCLQENLTVQVLSVHVLYHPEEIFSEVEDQLKRIRQDYIVSTDYSSVGVLELHVNEYGRAKQYGRPGSMLALLRVMERSGVDQAMRAIWGPPEAFTDDVNGYLVFAGLAEPLVSEEEFTQGGTLSGLLTADLKPRANWWAYKYYADGAPSRVYASSQLDYVMPIASNSSGLLSHKQVLLANYGDNLLAEPSNTVGVNLRGISAEDGASIKVALIPYQEAGELQEPSVICECSLGPQTGDEVEFSIEMPERYGVIRVTFED